MANEEQLGLPQARNRGTELLTEDDANYASSLNRILDSFYLAMADALTAAKDHLKVAKLEPEIYKDILPEQVLILSAHLGLIPLADEVNGVPVGRFFIDPKVKEEVLESLSSVVTLFEVTESDTYDRWEHPSPPEYVDRFLQAKSGRKPSAWRQLDLINELSLDERSKRPEPTKWEANKKFLQHWIYREPPSYDKTIPDERTRDRVDTLLKLMNHYAPESDQLTFEKFWWKPSF